MDLLSIPTSFSEAVKHLLAKSLLPTGLGSAEIKQLDSGIRRQSLFSARTTNEYYLDQIKNAVDSVLNPQTIQRPDRVSPTNPAGNVTVGMNPATARASLRQTLRDLGYKPDEEDEGTIKDLSSDARLNLVVKTNVELAQGAGQFAQGNANQDVVDAFPAWELVRYEDREVPRGEKRGPERSIIPDPFNAWPTRFRAAATEAGDVDAIKVLDDTGRMIALKSSGTWEALGSGAGGYDDTLDNPFPPFAFNSGMWTEEVSRKECIAVGLIQEGDAVEPSSFDLGSLFKEAA